MRILRLVIAAAAACTAVVVSPTAARANPPSYVTVLTCHSGTGPTTLASYSPKVSTSVGAFNVGGPLWCRMQRTGKVTTSPPWPPMAAEGIASFNAFGNFTKVVDGTGLAGGFMYVHAFGAEYELPFAAPFAAGNAPFEIVGARDDDGGHDGLGTGVFHEPVVCAGGCISTGFNYTAFTVTLQDIP